MRLDTLLTRLRLVRTRGRAQKLIGEGHVRLDRRRVDKVACPVAPGQVLTVPIHGDVRVIEILDLPVRRGPPSEAEACYRRLDG
ncbi:S4 domain-containing protein [Sphingomicrobium astaxanthinifaciens]|uniref:S4 domain-containing protein n=1 Tax=Sphingomicrobium astaxanthinifaciens TaxID=1227949 RepID=UPI001FCAA062|nr:S4 domain-containing protein [Sphingomicrobium astaxanthinifaciens]MCJ7421269.1 RNA-binding S4 domain-containing protein [Sphingomicrobium astaxanthinifaciens]